MENVSQFEIEKLTPSSGSPDGLNDKLVEVPDQLDLQLDGVHLGSDQQLCKQPSKQRP